MYEYQDNSTDGMSDATNDGLPPKRQRKSTSTNSKFSEDSCVRRRGRRSSKNACPNRNAQMARENREKKKKYIQHLEGQVKHYSEQTKRCESIIQKQQINERRLQAKVAYLQSILNNRSNITVLLKSLNENLKKNVPNQEQMYSRPILEDSKIQSNDQLVHNGNCEDLAQTERIELYGRNSPEFVDLYPNLNLYVYSITPANHLLLTGDDPFLSPKPESVDLPFTPVSTEDISEKYHSLKDNLDLENCGLDEARALDFGTQPNPFFEDIYCSCQDEQFAFGE